MINFLCQKEEGHPYMDTGYALLLSKEYFDWKSGSSEKLNIVFMSFEDMKKSDGYENYIPVGTVEFFYEFMKKYVNENAERIIKPLNVPECLYKFTGNRVHVIELNQETRSEISRNSEYEGVFLKSVDIIKYKDNGFYFSGRYISELPDGKYQIYKKIYDITSEWRCFVYNSNIVGCYCYSSEYSGSYMIRKAEQISFPDGKKLEEIVNEYSKDSNCPDIYTLDVCVSDEGTFVIECHEMFSCGLYGFGQTDVSILPFMLSKTYYNIKRRLIRNE
jgi:hypothetical protein